MDKKKKELIFFSELTITAHVIYRADQTRFFSYTATSEGVSLIADQHILHLFEEEALFQEQDTVPLRVIQVNLAGTNIDRCGIVRSIAHPLANEAHINLLYLSTFKSANIIVRSNIYCI